MNAPATLAPTTGILLTAMQSGMSYIDAAAEFVDNAFGPAAGNADTIWIADARDAVIFLDQGNGVRDINLLFRLGDGDSRNSAQDIGRFGVGSKFGALTFGQDVEVHTVRDGRYHNFRVDWEKVLESGKWPAEYDGKGRNIRNAPKAVRKGGTMIVVRKTFDHKRRPFEATWVTELGSRFQVALLDGKDIRFSRANSLNSFLSGRSKGEISIAEKFEAMLEESLTDRGVADIVLGSNLDCEIMFGKLQTGNRKLSGVHVSFGGRTIEIIDRVFNDKGEEIKLPGKFFARVDLSDGWKEHLNFNKTKIVNYRDELLAAIYKAAQPLIDSMLGDESSVVLEKLSLQLTNMLNLTVGKKLVTRGERLYTPTDEDGDLSPDNKRKTDTPINPSPEDVHKGDHNHGAKEGDTHGGSGGVFELTINATPEGVDGNASTAVLEQSGGNVTCTVNFNVDYPFMNELMMGKGNGTEGKLLVCLNALADTLARDAMDNGPWAVRMFDPEKYSELHNLSHFDVHQAVFNELTKSVTKE